MDIILIAGVWLPQSIWAETSAELERHGNRPIPVALPGFQLHPDEHELSAFLKDMHAVIEGYVQTEPDRAATERPVYGLLVAAHKMGDEE